jgi:hypothetical protein
MKMRKFFHIAAVMFSSFAALITHGKAQETTGTSTSKEKKGEQTRHHRHHNGDIEGSDSAALDDPPHHSKIHDSDTSDGIKNSKHAASWTSYAKQETGAPLGFKSDSTDPDSVTPPPLKLDPALMAGAEHPFEAPANSSIVPSALPPPLPGDEQSRYPWRRQIVTTTFWIGETPTHNNPVPNSASCWDSHWAKNYGGDDIPDPTQRTAEYIPASFSPGQNPFYVALPYNDMEHGAHKAEASQVIPWFPKDYKGPGQSVCKGRWIAIRFGNKVCYAQWEDAGPFRTDHWQYVFGNDRPRWNLNGGAGLDVSPAVRDYLGMNSSDVTDWKFVDFDEIPTGPWARYGENNTFVQNARKPGSQVAEVILDPQPMGLHSIVPGVQSPTVEIR